MSDPPPEVVAELEEAVGREADQLVDQLIVRFRSKSRNLKVTPPLAAGASAGTATMGSPPSTSTIRLLPWLGSVATFLTDTPVFLLPERLNLQPKHRVLELQAGSAAIIRFLVGRIAFDVPPVAIDASPAVVRQLRGDLDAHPSVDLVASRLGRLPFATATFDLVIAAHLFHRLDDAELSRCMAEAHRVLRPGGVFAGWDFAPTSSRTLNRLHRRLLSRAAQLPRLRGFGPLADVASSAGFARIERPVLRPFLFPPIPRTAILAQKGEEADRGQPPVVGPGWSLRVF